MELLPSLELLDQMEHLNIENARRICQIVQSFLKCLDKKDKMEFSKILKNYQGDFYSIFQTEFLPSIRPCYFDLLKQILDQYCYRFSSDILEAISNVSILNDPTLINRWKLFPWISSFNYEAKTNEYMISSELDQFSFVPTCEIYPSDVLKIMKNHQAFYQDDKTDLSIYHPHAPGNLEYACHFSTEEFAKMHPDFFAVTCVCPRSFYDTYWLHSYNLTPDKQYVVDIANGYVMPHEMQKKLLNLKILDCTLGSDIPKRIEQIEQDKENFFADVVRSNPLKTFALLEYDCMSPQKRRNLLHFN